MKHVRRIHNSVMAATVLGMVVSVLIGCSAQRISTTEAPVIGSRSTHLVASPTYRIQPGDQMDIKFFFNPELNETVFVRPDGKISLQLVDDVQAAGLTPSELDEVLSRVYAKELRQPEVTVIVRTLTAQLVYVGGEVQKPGAVELTPGMTALQAVINAGGFKDTAKLEEVLVIRDGWADAPIPIRANLTQPIANDVALQSHDIVYVPRTWIADANLFVQQYVEGLLMFKGWGISLRNRQGF
ncbi:polysaccharide biosynthesis/export family protein [Petrachloros mirabilis]